MTVCVENCQGQTKKKIIADRLTFIFHRFLSLNMYKKAYVIIEMIITEDNY